MTPPEPHPADDGSAGPPRQSTPRQGHRDAPSITGTAGSEIPSLEFSPDWKTSPGEILQHLLDRRRLTQAELAIRTGLTPKHINQVIKGIASLSPDMALRLERALDVPSHVWNTLEANYQSHQTRRKSNERLAEYTNWLHRFPLVELVNRDVLAKNDDQITQIDKLLAFFRVADPDAYDRAWAEPVAAGFRRSQYTEVDPYATAVWLRLGERAAEKRQYADYDPLHFSQLLPDLRHLTQLPDHKALTELQRNCASAGVAVEFVREVKGSRANGAARWVNAARPMILLSGRYRYHDIFWFSFFHEAAHLLLHPKRRTVVHVEDGGDNTDGQETAANDYAAEILVPSPHSAKLTADTTPEEARRIADSIGVHPGIVAGQLCHRYNRWNRYAKLRRKLDDWF